MTESDEPVRLSSPSVVLGFLFGLVYAGAVSGYAHDLGYPVLEFESPVVLYPIVLLVTAGTIPVFAFVRRRTVTPAAVLVATTYLWVSAEANGVSGPGDPFAGFLGLLPLWIGLMVLVGLVEQALRDRLFRAVEVG